MEYFYTQVETIQLLQQKLIPKENRSNKINPNLEI